MPYSSIHMNFGHKQTCLAVKKGMKQPYFTILGNLVHLSITKKAYLYIWAKFKG